MSDKTLKTRTATSVEDEMTPDQKLSHWQSVARQLQNENDRLHQQIGGDEALFESIKGGVGQLKPYARPPLPKPKHGSAEHTAVAIITDTHSDEYVNPAEMEGLAHHTWETHTERMALFSDKVLEITNIMRASASVPNLVIWLLGDFFIGQIHPEEGAYGETMTMPQALPAEGQVLADTIMRMARGFEKVRVVGICGNHGRNCYDSETEILTENGWKRIENIDRKKEKVAVFIPERDTIEYEVPRSWFVEDYSGEMVMLKSRSIDLLVTPEHTLWVKAPSATVNGKRYNYGFAKRKANERAWNKSHWLAQCAVTGWSGSSDVIDVPASARIKGLSIEPTEDWAKLFGWYISEGSCDRSRVAICQSSSVNPSNCEEITCLIRRLGFKPSVRHNMIRFGHTPLATFLRCEFGEVSSEKHIPAWLKKWPKKLLLPFFEAAMSGDGTWDRGRKSGRYTSTSDMLIDDMQEVCFKLGYSARATDRYWQRFGNTKYVGSARKLCVCRKHIRTMASSRRVQYKGVIWCPTVSSGLVIVRRKGCATISGNTHKPVFKMTADRNWDMSVYLIAQQIARAQENVEWVLPKSIMHVEDVMGWKELLTHGNVANVTHRTPYFGIEDSFFKQRDARRKTTQDFDHVWMGHFHHEFTLRGFIRGCPSMIGANQFSQYKMHCASSAQQRLVMFTEKHGPTSEWLINL